MESILPPRLARNDRAEWSRDWLWGLLPPNATRRSHGRRGCFTPRRHLHLVLALNQAIARLDTRHATVLHLGYWHAFTTAEIAVRLGLAQGTVKCRPHEARRGIRQDIEGGKGVEWLVYLCQTRPELPMMMLGPAVERTICAAWAARAEAYLTVPANVDELAGLVERVVAAWG